MSTLRLVDKQPMESVPKDGRIFCEYKDGSVQEAEARTVWKLFQNADLEYWAGFHTAWSYTATFEPETKPEGAINNQIEE